MFFAMIAMAIIACASFALSPMVMMPGKSFGAILPALTSEQTVVQQHLQEELAYLTVHIGQRNEAKPGTLEQSADYIASQFAAIAHEPGQVKRQKFRWDGREFQNVCLQLKGDTLPDEIIILGAHYDTVGDCVGADDNGSGIVGVIELARLMSKLPHHRTIRFVAFANEEFYFRQHGMGSYQYAERCHSRGEKITAMIALEMIGYFRDEKSSQKYPLFIGMFYPDKANFITFIGNLQNRPLVTRMLGVFRKDAQFPSQAIAAPRAVQGVDWSDHFYFWEFGYPALMVSDTAFYRNPNYHQPSDKLDTINFDKMTRVVTGLVPCITDLAND